MIHVHYIPTNKGWQTKVTRKDLQLAASSVQPSVALTWHFISLKMKLNKLKLAALTHKNKKFKFNCCLPSEQEVSNVLYTTHKLPASFISCIYKGNLLYYLLKQRVFCHHTGNWRIVTRTVKTSRWHSPGMLIRLPRLSLLWYRLFIREDKAILLFRAIIEPYFDHCGALTTTS